MKLDGAANVLVVDDEPDHARVLAIGLCIEGFEVETASDAEGALNAISGGTIDLAIVDLMMPGTNGIQLARTIRERFPHVRVVLISACHLSARQLVLADCGAVGFVPKPFDLRVSHLVVPENLTARIPETLAAPGRSAERDFGDHQRATSRADRGHDSHAAPS